MVRMVCALGVASATLDTAGADEGVWTFDNPPAKALQSGYGFTPSAEWLDALRLSAVRLGGGSGSFVSANGLVLSNHHVAMGCLQALSTAADDIVRNGFYARTRAEERPCPGLDLRRLESTEDVTGKVRAAVKSTDDGLATAERNAAIAALENECREKTGQRCEMVTLFRGGAYHLYRYRIWNDIRLEFAPEARRGAFGGDPDNFVFPRFDLVGLIFDGNLEGLGGRYAYTDRKARAISVDGRAIVEALTKVYGAIPLAAEFSGRQIAWQP